MRHTLRELRVMGGKDSFESRIYQHMYVQKVRGLGDGRDDLALALSWKQEAVRSVSRLHGWGRVFIAYRACTCSHRTSMRCRSRPCCSLGGWRSRTLKDRSESEQVLVMLRPQKLTGP